MEIEPSNKTAIIKVEINATRVTAELENDDKSITDMAS